MSTGPKAQQMLADADRLRADYRERLLRYCKGDFGVVARLLGKWNGCVKNRQWLTLTGEDLAILHESFRVAVITAFADMKDVEESEQPPSGAA